MPLTAFVERFRAQRNAGWKILDAVLNGALLCMVLILTNFLTKNVFSTDTPRRRELPSIQIGQRVSVNGVDWKAARRTLIMAVSDKCVFCQRSEPFYRKLTRYLDNTVAVVGLSQDPPEVTAAYLQRLGINRLVTKQVSLREMGIMATPTLVLVDGEGYVESVWLGKLAAASEGALIQAISPKAPTPPERKRQDLAELPEGDLPDYLDVASVKRIAARKSRVTILDVREREEFALEHLRGAINIPSDEIVARSTEELPIGGRLAVYCGRCAPCANGSPNFPLTQCIFVKETLWREGFKKTSIIQDDLSVLRKEGLAIAASSQPMGRKKSDSP